MAGVSVGSSAGPGRRAVDSNVNMVPMIDLLISVIAFLLMTAVWVQTGQLAAHQPRAAGPSSDPAPAVFHMTLSEAGVTLGVTAADSVTIPPGPEQLERVRETLTQRHAAAPQQNEVWIQPDGTVHYDQVTSVMDVVYDVWGHGATQGQRVGDRVAIRFL